MSDEPNDPTESNAEGDTKESTPKTVFGTARINIELGAGKPARR